MTRIKLSKSAPLQASLNTVSRAHIAEDSIEKQSAENTKSQLIETKSDSIVLNTQDSTDKTAKEISSDRDIADEYHKITAPLVGTYYSSSKPGDPPFIKVGDSIEPGQILCIIEAMKIFNEIESEVSGVVKEVLVVDSTPVEYGQAIISVKLND